MKNKTMQRLDDGQPLVEFAPLKPAEFLLGLRPMSATLQRHAGIILSEEQETI